MTTNALGLAPCPLAGGVRGVERDFSNPAPILGPRKGVPLVDLPSRPTGDPLPQVYIDTSILWLYTETCLRPVSGGRQWTMTGTLAPFRRR